MQPTVACTSCGAEIPAEARFCRNCGQPSARFNRESVTEGTTRLLETPERPPAPPPAQDVYQQHPGGPGQPTNRLPPQTNPTSYALEPVRKPTNWVLIGAIVVAALALIATGLVIGLRSRTAATTPNSPPVVRQGPGPIPPPAPPASIPQPPPPPGVTEGEGGGISSALIYPGSTTVMRSTGNREGEGNMVMLRTSDSFDTVVSWYKQRLKTEQAIEQGDLGEGLPGRSVILPTEDVTAIITAQGDTTSIMLAQDGH
ncbi:MAG TPA: zinc ribbon domain-containing protein [Pyrinomonadaceae bacterium]|nr:zinc ribbon domain-containing protein [Pyrinomonadaceae bacterium]